MSVDTKDLILVGGIGAAGLFLLSRKQDDPFSGMGGFWGGGGGSRETVTIVEETPIDEVPPTIVLPPIEPYQVDTTVPEWLFSRPTPVSGGDGTGDSIPRTKKEATVSSAADTEQHENIGPTGGFGGGAVGGRGADDGGGILGLLGGIISSVFSPVNLALSAPLLGGVAGVLGPATTAVLPAFEAVTKKGAATATTTSYIASAPIVSSPADAISEFHGAGADYTTPVDMTKKGSAVTTVYESGAYQTVSQGQIVSAGSPGSTAPPASAPSTGAAHAAVTGQVYSPPGSSLGGSSGTVMSKKSASILSGDSAAARAWRARYGGG